MRTFTSGELLPAGTFPVGRYDGPRHTLTAIYYLLEPDTFSEMHLLASDELFHHYLGDPVEMLQLHSGGLSSHHILGPNLLAGYVPQLAVRRGVWQGSRLLRKDPQDAGSGPRTHGFALLGCTVAPGFEYADYRSASRAELVQGWPAEAALITALTRE